MTTDYVLSKGADSKARALLASFIGACSLTLGCGAGADLASDEQALDESAAGTASAALQGAAVCMLGAAQPLPRVDATASSVEAPSLAPGFAIDGDPGTRWSSAFSNPQWIRVDLGAVRYIDTVSLSWETASSQRYEVQVSHDGLSWKSVKFVGYDSSGAHQSTFSGLNAKGRYVRVYSHERTTQWGVSLYDISVLGDANGACTQPGAVRIDALHSGRSLDVKDWSTIDGGAVQQWGYGGGNNQKWTLLRGFDGQYQIKSLHSGKCLDVDGTADGARVQQWSCHSGPNQRFSFKAAGNGQHQIVAQHSGKCLDVAWGSASDGASVIQWPCHGGDNQKWSVIDPRDTQTDSENCGELGHSCRGGACVAGTCQAALVVSDFQCSSSMAATETHLYVGDVGNINRYDLSGYNKVRVVSGNNDYVGELIRNGNQFFWQNGTSLRRFQDGQAAATTLFSGAVAQLSLTGQTVVAYEHETKRFVAVDRNLSSPGSFSVITTLDVEYPMWSAATSSHLYYVYGTSAGSGVYQVNRSSGQRVRVNDGTESIFGISAYGDTVYWNYRTNAGQTGIRRLSSAAGAVVEEAVLPTQGSQSIGNALVDASGIYHAYYDGTNNFYYRTSHEDRAQRTLVTNGGAFPYQSTNAALTSDSIYWLSTCHRYGGGWLYRLVKP